MVRNHDRGRTGLLCLQRTLHGHDALHDERNAGGLHDFTQLRDRLTAGWRGQILEERKTCRVDIHRHGESIGLLYKRHLLAHCLDVPRLHGRDAETTGLLYRCSRRRHDLRIRAVTGERRDAMRRTRRHQDVVVGDVVQRIAVVQIHCADRAREKRIREVLSEQLEGGVDRTLLYQRIHLKTDLLPLIIVADRRVTDTLRTRTRNLVPACTPVTLRTRLTVLPDARSRLLYTLRKIHIMPLFLYAMCSLLYTVATKVKHFFTYRKLSLRCHSYFASLHTHVALSRYASVLIHVHLRASSHAHV